jgi:hypothetical protein
MALDEEQIDELRKHKNYISSVIKDSQQEYSKQILSLASAVLALSVAFLKSVVIIESASLLSLLYAAWGLLLAAIFITLLAIKISIKAHQLYLEDLGKEIEGKEDEVTGLTWRDWWMPKSTWLATVSFLGGVSILVLFSIVNIQRERSMHYDKNKGSLTETGSSALGRQTIHDHVEVQRIKPAQTKPPADTSTPQNPPTPIQIDKQK